MMTNIDVYFSLGTNLGDRRNNIDRAVSMLGRIPGLTVTAVSEIIETEPWGFNADTRFLNCAVRAAFILDEVDSKDPDQAMAENSALRLLDECKRIEKEMGRNEIIETDPEGNRIYHSRTIDIDILIFGQYIIDNQKLKIPHPLMRQRDFVMVPLRQIARDDVKSMLE